jgi:hypothetical protein
MLSLSVENQPHGQAHFVFADTQANAEKLKSLSRTCFGKLALSHLTQTGR